MSRKSDAALFTLFIAIGLPILLLKGAVDSIGGAAVAGLAIAAIGAVIALTIYARNAKRNRLLAKYGDTQVVQRIMDRMF